MYGCGLTEHGQLPFLRYSRSAVLDGSSSSSGGSDGEEESEGAGAAGPKPRDEITIPTRLRLPFLQASVCIATVCSGSSPGFCSCCLRSTCAHGCLPAWP